MPQRGAGRGYARGCETVNLTHGYYGFGETVTERQLLIKLFDLLPEEEETVTRSEGFSLLDLQRVAQARGYSAQGFRLEPDQLALLGGPVIVFIEPRGYRHFAVLRGVRGDRVHLADPARGNIRMPAYTFLEDWLQDDGTGDHLRGRAGDRSSRRQNTIEPRPGGAPPTRNHDRPRDAGGGQPVRAVAGTFKVERWPQ